MVGKEEVAVSLTKAMYSEVDVFIGNHTLVDPEIYDMWINGNTAQEAANILQDRGVLRETGAVVDLLLSDVLDHYHSYSMLERLLQNPTKLSEQWTFQIAPQTQKMLVEKYYAFDDVVIREILGKKLSSRHRKDLDEVSEKTGILLKSCRRQFDNVKRVYKAVEELTGPLVQNIQSHFLLPEELARKYATVVFITCNRFETSKRKLQYLTFDDFYHCANAIMVQWTTQDASPDTDLDREFLMYLRDLRILLDREKEHKHLVCQRLRSEVSDRTYMEVESNFKVYSRTLINIAYSLNHSKDLRDLFIDLVEKYIEPCKQLQWPAADMATFLQVYTRAALELDVMRGKSDLKLVWGGYMEGISACLLQMYHS